MKLVDVLNLEGSIPEMDFFELICLWSDLAEAKSQIECLQAQAEEIVRERVAAEIKKTEAETAIRLLQIRTGVGQ